MKKSWFTFNSVKFFWFLFFLAFTPRLILISFNVEAPLFTDMLEYHEKAVRLLELGKLSAFRPPLYPLFLAITYSIFGTKVGVIYLIQALLGAGLALLTYFLTINLAEKKIAYGASIIVALYPALIYYPSFLLSENLYLPLTIASLFSLLQALKVRSYKWSALAGVALALASLTRSISFGFFLIAVIWLFIQAREQNSKNMEKTNKNSFPFYLSAVFLFSFLLTILPITLKNYLFYKELVIIDTSGGYNFLVGNNPRASGRLERNILPWLKETYYPKDTDDRQRQAIGYREGLKFILKNPAHWLLLGLKKWHFLFGAELREFIWFYSFNYFGSLPVIILIIGLLSLIIPFSLLSAFACWGIICPKNNYLNHQHSLLITFIIYTMLVHFLSFGESRFHLPLIPILSIYAVTGYNIISNMFKKKQFNFKTRYFCFSLGLVLILWCNIGWNVAQHWNKISLIMKPGGNLLHFPY